MTQMTLLRHSISQAGEDGIHDSGRYDAPLSEKGKYLAYYSADLVQECPDAIYTSDMKRALGTAEIYADVFRLKFGKDVPVISVPALRGQDHGQLEGLSFNSTQYKLLTFREEEDIPRPDLGGEKNTAAYARQMLGFVIVENSAQEKGYKKILTVTHTDVIARFEITADENIAEVEMPANCQSVGPFDLTATVAKLIPPPELPKNDSPRTPPAKPPTP